MSKNGRKNTYIHLNYFKQGDDLCHCIVKNDDDTVNVKETINNHIALLEGAIKHLKDINDIIPDVNTCSIYGDTHYIGLEGDERIIDQLILKDLAHLEEGFDEEDSDIFEETGDSDTDVNIDDDGNDVIGDENIDVNVNDVYNEEENLYI